MCDGRAHVRERDARHTVWVPVDVRVLPSAVETE